MNGLDLFSGYGGISRALSPWVRTVAYCENHPFRQLVLLQEMQEGRLDVGPIWDDVRTLQKYHFNDRINVITGGWPCQGHSVAGAKKGLADERSGLATELIRLIRELRPDFCFLENVPGVFVSGFGSITAELSMAGYVGRYGVLSCIDVAEDAWHERERVWIALADSDSLGHWESLEQVLEQGREGAPGAGSNGEEGTASHSLRSRLQGWIEPNETWLPLPFVTAAPGAAWPEGVPEPTLCGKDDGPAVWRNAIETLGGGVVPQVAREAFQRLFGMKEMR